MQLLSSQEMRRSPACALADDRLVVALEILWRAHRYATDAGVEGWDFAVEIDEFRRVQIFNNELRWLLTRGYALHAVETKAAGGRRQFCQASVGTLTESSCFILSEAGAALIESWSVTLPQDELLGARSFSSRDAAASGQTTGVMVEREPMWDPKRRKLWVEGQLIKHYQCPAPSQQLILSAFQAAHWSAHVSDPLPLLPGQCPKRRLHDAIKRLNRGHGFQAIRFSGDGTGRGVLWNRLG